MVSHGRWYLPLLALGLGITCVPVALANRAVPEFFQCFRVAGGAYEDSECAIAGGTKQYSRKIAGAGLLYLATAGAVKITTAKHKFECSVLKTKGETGSSSSLVDISGGLEGCEDRTTTKLWQTSAKNEIVLNKLRGKLVYLKATKMTPVGLFLEPEGTLIWSKFTCEGPEYELEGRLIGEFSPLEQARTTLFGTYAEAGGVQQYRQVEEGGALAELSIKPSGQPKEPAVFVATENQTWKCPNMGVEYK